MGYFIKDEVIYGGDTDFTFASVSAMNTAITNGNVPDGAVCYVQGEGIYKISGTTPVKYGSLGGGSGGGGYHMASSDTAGATAAKVVTTTSGDYTPATGTGLFVKFDYDNTANGVTLNVDDSGVKTLQWNGSAISASAIKAGILYNVIYDGTYYQIVGSVAGVDAYDNSTSGLVADNTQDAIDELLTMNPTVFSAYNRWLRFDPSNKKGLIIKGGTSIRKADGKFAHFNADTQIDLTSQLSSVGANYYLHLNNDGTFTASTTALSIGVKIGRFHTLCVGVGSATMIAPSSGLAVGANFLVKSYSQETDPDFFNLYNKQITALTTQTQYDVATMAHPLVGYSAGDILPESVFCLTWHPSSLYDDAMVYDKDMDIMVDVYLQSGKGTNTRSAYNATHTVSRTAGNHMEDMRQVGKRLLSDAEFTSMAIGSNEKTNITGSSDKTTVGGHVDTANRRMISAIGVEEACGYLWQWTSELVGAKSDSPNNTWANPDGHGSFGQEYWMPYVRVAGGNWNEGTHCGSRSRSSDGVRSTVSTHIGGRGSSQVIRGL